MGGGEQKKKLGVKREMGGSGDKIPIQFALLPRLVELLVLK